MDKESLKNLIHDLINKVVPVKEVVLAPDESNGLWFKVDISDAHLFTYREGEALMALNHIIRRIVENKIDNSEETVQFLVDINDFQKKKIDSIKAVAHMMAERARYFKSSVEVDPMSSFERRIVHEFLSNEADLSTESIGLGPQRRVVIKYTGTL